MYILSFVHAVTECGGSISIVRLFCFMEVENCFMEAQYFSVKIRLFSVEICVCSVETNAFVAFVMKFLLKL